MCNYTNFHEILSFKSSLQVYGTEFKSREYHLVSTCTTAVHSFQNPICAAGFVLFTATCFFASVHGRHDTINSHLTQIFMWATVNVKTMMLDFVYLCISSDELSSSLTGYKFCYMSLCTCVYKISKFAHNTYTKILSGYKCKNVRAYRICKFVHDSYH